MGLHRKCPWWKNANKELRKWQPHRQGRYPNYVCAPWAWSQCDKLSVYLHKGWRNLAERNNNSLKEKLVFLLKSSGPARVSWKRREGMKQTTRENERERRMNEWRQWKANNFLRTRENDDTKLKKVKSRDETDSNKMNSCREVRPCHHELLSWIWH